MCREKQVNLICILEYWLKESQVDLFVPSNFIPAQEVYEEKLQRMEV